MTVDEVEREFTQMVRKCIDHRGVEVARLFEILTEETFYLRGLSATEETHKRSKQVLVRLSRER